MNTQSLRRATGTIKQKLRIEERVNLLQQLGFTMREIGNMLKDSQKHITDQTTNLLTQGEKRLIG